MDINPFDKDGNHKNGIMYDDREFDKDGYDEYNYDKEKFNRNGFNKYGYNWEGRNVLDKFRTKGRFLP